jgi:hypothetical protein
LKARIPPIKYLILMKKILLSFILAAASLHGFAQQSVARQWSDVMLNCIRKDFARPTVTARTIAHSSWAMYDAYAIYDGSMEPYLIGHTVGPYTSYFSGVPMPDDVQAAQEEAISFAMYRWLTYRYQTTTPSGAWNNFMSVYINTLMNSLGYDTSITSTDYTDGDPAKLGNFIAQELINYGLLDGTNKANNHANQYYSPVNGDIWADLPGNPNCLDPNRWQPLSLTIQIDDQTGLPIMNGAPALSVEWGNAVPFAMTQDQATVHTRDEHDWKVYLDPGAPPMLDTTVQTGLEDLFKWGYFTNVLWHSYHDSEDGAMIDISPNNIGNLQTLPDEFEDYPAFYDIFNGGPNDPGYAVNPATGMPYAPQVVKRGDFTRVLSEYWADGPSSETPPGHWVKIFNEVADHPELEKKWMGTGPVLSNLEWDVRGYFAMCSGLYDAAIACWSAKGYYDYTRPIMAIRYMCDKGQSSDPNLPSYHPAGMPLVPGYVELVEMGDPLAGANNENVGKIKLFTWAGPPAEPLTQTAGVDWILGEKWHTYQKKSFVTPPFPGYYSGHSTYSRAAAEIMTLITGDEYFPGGMSQFVAQAGEYLLADDGPSETITLQWAKYKDASDQCSLSRIYGGLHPPQDDIPGRKVGMVVGPQAFNKVNDMLQAGLPYATSVSISDNDITQSDVDGQVVLTVEFSETMNTSINPNIAQAGDDATANSLIQVDAIWIDSNTFQVTYDVVDANEHLDHVVFSVNGAVDIDGNTQNPGLSNVAEINTFNAEGEVVISDNLINDSNVGTNELNVTITYDTEMDISIEPNITFGEGNSTLILNYGYWEETNIYIAQFDVIDENIELDGLSVQVTGGLDMNGVEQDPSVLIDALDIDTQSPSVVLNFNMSVINDLAAGQTLEITAAFDDIMNTEFAPTLTYPSENPEDYGLIPLSDQWMWLDDSNYMFVFAITDENIELSEIDLNISSAIDNAGNEQFASFYGNAILVETTNPQLILTESSLPVLSDQVANGAFGISLFFTYDEPMDILVEPQISFNNSAGSAGLTPSTDEEESEWINENTYMAVYYLIDEDVDIADWQAFATGAVDIYGNPQGDATVETDLFDIDTENPSVVAISANDVELTQENQTPPAFVLFINFDQAMDTSTDPIISFPNEDPTATLTLMGTEWLNPYTCSVTYNMDNDVVAIEDIDIAVEGATDANGNELNAFTEEDFFDINTTISVSEIGDLSAFNIYPNPVFSGQIATLEWESTQTSQLSIYNMLGELVMSEQNIPAGRQVRRIDTQNFASGMYLVNVYDGSQWIKQSLQIVK